MLLVVYNSLSYMVYCLYRKSQMMEYRESLKVRRSSRIINVLEIIYEVNLGKIVIHFNTYIQ